MVPKHPPPNFFAPYPASKPLNILFIAIYFNVTVNLGIKSIGVFIIIFKNLSLFTDSYKKNTNISVGAF